MTRGTNISPNVEAPSMCEREDPFNWRKDALQREMLSNTKGEKHWSALWKCDKHWLIMFWSFLKSMKGSIFLGRFPILNLHEFVPYGRHQHTLASVTFPSTKCEGTQNIWVSIAHCQRVDYWYIWYISIDVIHNLANLL